MVCSSEAIKRYKTMYGDYWFQVLIIMIKGLSAEEKQNIDFKELIKEMRS